MVVDSLNDKKGASVCPFLSLLGYEQKSLYDRKGNTAVPQFSSNTELSVDFKTKIWV